MYLVFHMKVDQSRELLLDMDIKIKQTMECMWPSKDKVIFILFSKMETKKLSVVIISIWHSKFKKFKQIRQFKNIEKKYCFKI